MDHASRCGVPPELGMLLAAATASALRVVALIAGYTLPRWSSQGDA